MKKTALTICSALFALCCLLAACSNPAEGQKEMATFTIDLGASGRAVYPPDTASISELRYEVSFSQGSSVIKKFTAERSSVLQGSIDTGTYDVTLEVFFISGGFLFAEGEAISPANPVTIVQGNNTITVKANRSLSISPDNPTVSIGGAPQQFSASIHGGLSAGIVWTVEGNSDTGTTIDPTGKLTVGALESTSTVLTVTAVTSGLTPERKSSTRVSLTNKVNGIAPSLSGPVTTAYNYTIPASATPLSVIVENDGAPPNDDISAQHTALGGVGITYQWYRNTANSSSGGTVIASATALTYTPPVTTSDIGTYYYYMVARNEIYNNGDSGTKVVNTASDVATVTVKQPLTITITTPPSRTLTPIVSTSPAYTEREDTFIVQVGGFLSLADSADVGLTYTNVTGLTFSGHLAANGVSTTTDKTFTVKMVYNGTQAFATPSQTITITGLSSILTAKYVYSGGNKTTTVSIIDGQDSGTSPDRRIPVNATNIEAFNTYANSSANNYAGLKKHYKLAASISLPSVGAGSSNWTPIGTNGSRFTGSFDGQNNTINGLTIGVISTQYAGLFGYIGNGGSVKNLGLVGGTVTGSSGIGGLAGGNYGTIENCYTTGNVTVTNNGSAGGIAGVNYSSIENCYSAVSVTGGTGMAGGIVGFNDQGMIKNCYAAGSVSNLSNPVGGIAGRNRNGSIENCYSLSVISGYDRVGGIVGDSSSSGNTVQNCVALNTSVTAANYGAGRISGASVDSATFNNNHAKSGMPVIIGGGTTYPSGTLTDKDGADIPSNPSFPSGRQTDPTWWDNESGLGWVWGTDSSNPWKWDATLQRPVLWFEP